MVMVRVRVRDRVRVMVSVRVSSGELKMFLIRRYLAVCIGQ